MEETVQRPTENKMGVLPIRRLLVGMSLPMMTSMLIQACYNIVDSIFVAHINENALTAVSLAFPMQMLMIAVATGTGVGINAYLSKSLGQRRRELVNRIAANGVFLALVSSLAFMFFGLFLAERFFLAQTDIPEIIAHGKEYLTVVCGLSIGVFTQVTLERLLASTGRTIYYMLAQLSGAVANLILDPIMIFGLLGCPRMGVFGAAAATVAGQFLAAGLALHFNLRKNHDIALSLRGFRPDFGIAIRIYLVGVPSILMAGVGSLMAYGMNQILLPFTATAAAVFGIYFKLQSFFIMPVFGLNNAMVPIVAYNYGARNRERVVQTVKFAMVCAEAVMILGLAAFLALPERLLGLFNANDHMLAIGVPALRIIGLHYAVAGFCIVSISTFQALGNGMYSLLVAVTRQLVVLLPSAWLLSLTGSLAAIWWAFPIAESATMIVCLLLLKRIGGRGLPSSASGRLMPGD